MSNIWHDISPKRISPEDFISVIEIPKGSKKSTNLIRKQVLLFLTESFIHLLTIRQTMALYRGRWAMTETHWIFCFSALKLLSL